MVVAREYVEKAGMVQIRSRCLIPIIHQVSADNEAAPLPTSSQGKRNAKTRPPGFFMKATKGQANSQVSS